uniref:BTB domain-containing protein n=1 Tax=Oryzias melastigma TaxID=30732 RepID=A0A3B3DFK9_ORYME
MFTRGFKECSASEVTLCDVCPEVVGRLIDFAYTARITVGETCVLHVLLSAMRFQMEDVAKACCDFLIKHLEAANVIGILRFAEEIGCTELHQQCREYINTHFSEVILGPSRHGEQGSVSPRPPQCGPHLRAASEIPEKAARVLPHPQQGERPQ